MRRLNEAAGESPKVVRAAIKAMLRDGNRRAQIERSPGPRCGASSTGTRINQGP
jgi:hypothetical protein